MKPSAMINASAPGKKPDERALNMFGSGAAGLAAAVVGLLLGRLA